MGADGRVGGIWGGKNDFLPDQTSGVWCILGLLFTFMQKLVRSIGRPPLNPPLSVLPDLGRIM